MEICDWNRALCDKLNPAPVTPEILEQCGFVWQPEEKDIYGKEIPGQWYHEAYSDYPGLFYLPDYKIEYVHQIQNLYFAITGKDLEINL